MHNEAGFVSGSVEAMLTVLRESSLNFTLSLAEDGSTDGTKSCLAEIHTRHPEILIQSDPVKHGRGWALRKLWTEVPADFYAFSDTDLAADPKYLVRAIRIAMEGVPIVTGSRYAAAAHVRRPPLRWIVSLAYNRILRIIFRDHILDHQCGLKVFSGEAFRALGPWSHEESWFWDTEMLVLGHDAGFPIVEFPIDWVEKKTVRTHILRLASDVYLHGSRILRLAGSRRLAERVRRQASMYGPTSSSPRVAATAFRAVPSGRLERHGNGSGRAGERAAPGLEDRWA